MFRNNFYNSTSHRTLRDRLSNWRRAPSLIAACVLPVAPCILFANGWEHSAIPYSVLVEALESSKAEVRRQAAHSLGARGQLVAATALMKTLERPEPEGTVREAIYLALGRLDGATDTKRLIRCLSEETEVRVQSACVTSLGHIGGEDALEHLIAKVRSEEPGPLRLRAIEALGHFSDARAVNALAMALPEKSDHDAWPRIVRALGHTGAGAAAPILIRELHRVTEPAHRLLLARSLAHVGDPETSSELIKLLNAEKNPGVRAALVIAVGTSRGAGTLEALVRFLDSGDMRVRLNAVEALEELGNARASPQVAELALDTSRWLRSTDVSLLLSNELEALQRLTLLRAALRTCIQLDPASAFEAFISAAEPFSIGRGSAAALRAAELVYESRRLALYGLGYVGVVGESARAQATELLSGPSGAGDPDHRLRAVAARSLGVLSGPDSVRRVLVLADDKSAEVRWTVAMALGRSSDPKAAPVLLQGLRDSSAEVRRQSALGLGFLRWQEAKPALASLAQEDPDSRVREAAEFAGSLLGS